MKSLASSSVSQITAKFEILNFSQSNTFLSIKSQNFSLSNTFYVTLEMDFNIIYKVKEVIYYVWFI